jgi:hypothetical protein
MYTFMKSYLYIHIQVCESIGSTVVTAIILAAFMTFLLWVLVKCALRRLSGNRPKWERA